MDKVSQFKTQLSSTVDLLESAQEQLCDLEVLKLNSMQDLQNSISLLKGMQEQGLKVVVFGGFSSGKSSLINVLLDTDYLEVGTTATTATITRIRSAQGEAETATVSYKSENEIAVEAFGLLLNDQTDIELLAHRENHHLLKSLIEKFIDIEQCFEKDEDTGQFVLVKKLMRDFIPLVQGYLSVSPPAESLPPEKKSSWLLRRDYLTTLVTKLDSVENCLGSEQHIPVDELSEILSNEAKAFSARTVDLRLNCSVLEGDVQIVDTPGLGSIHQRHSSVSEAYVREADVIIYVLPDKGIGADDIRFVNLLAQRNEHLQENNVFFVANMVDSVISEKAREDLSQAHQEICEHKAFLKNTLAQYGLVADKLIPVSALLAKWANKARSGELNRQETRSYERVAMNFNENDCADPEINLMLSGIPGLQLKIRDYLSQNELNIRYHILYQSSMKSIEAMQMELIQNQVLLSASIDEMNEYIQQWQVKKEELAGNEHSKKELFKSAIRDNIDHYGIKGSRILMDEYLAQFTDIFADKYMDQRKSSRDLAQSATHTARKGAEAVTNVAISIFSWILNNDAEEVKLGSSSLEIRMNKLSMKALEQAKDKTAISAGLEQCEKQTQFQVSHVWDDGITSITDILNGFNSESVLSDKFNQCIKGINVFHEDSAMDAELDKLASTVVSASLFGGAGALFFVDPTQISSILMLTVATIKQLWSLSSPKKEKIKFKAKMNANITDNRIRIYNRTFEDKYHELQNRVINEFDLHVDWLINNYDEKIQLMRVEIDASQARKDDIQEESEFFEEFLGRVKKHIGSLMGDKHMSLDNTQSEVLEA